ncbi:MarR family transcriptional regulator [Exilibacterium tricleocarpae]|uniref:MarR family transcriptional regulator n=1 Tax=Exilibacterium tricleocarpae TaxID=2591008 RepID=A0A545TNQ4_9GAMM|nr:MarR family transcriptional regulator [Exilibacterium tricleocarpae]TQV78853.1 MarR family transcriptional regulator [Exilibacterium tricleocarpae]
MTEDRPKSLLLNHFIPYRMVNLAKRISDSCAGIYRDDFDITIPEWRILARLAEHDAQNSRCLGEVTFMDKSKVSRAVKLLDNKGYLVKRKDRDDNRVTYLSLSTAGRRLYQAIVPKALEWESRLIGALDISEYRDLMRILEKLERQLGVMDGVEPQSVPDRDSAAGS